jgi:ABC-2 type transport system permease protein
VNNNIKILVNTFFKLDFRDKENSSKIKFFGIFLSYLFANSVLSLNNFLTFNKESFIILSFSTGVFLFVFIILNDFGNLFFTKRNFDVINSLPIEDSEIVLSKFISAFLYLTVYAFIIAIPQIVFFCLYETHLLEIILFFFANLFSLFFISGVILILYTVSYRIFSKKSNLILYFLQFVFFFYVIAVSSLASKFSVEKTDILSLGFIKYFPQFYFAISINNPAILLLLILSTVFLYVIYFYYLKKNYRKISSVIFGYKEATKGKGNKRNFIIRYNEYICTRFIKNNEEKASYLLTLNQLSNSKSLKLKFIPLIFLPVIVCLIALFTDTYMFHSILGSKSSIMILTPSISFTFIMCVRLLISATKIEDENSPDVKWIFSSLPLLRIKRIQNANIKFVFINFAFPVIIILFLLLEIKFQILPLLLNFIFLLFASNAVNSLFLIFDRIYPFSLESNKYNSASKLGEILFIMLIGIAIFVAQIFIFENVIFVIISIILFLVISFLLKQKSFALKV